MNGMAWHGNGVNEILSRYWVDLQSIITGGLDTIY
jgi:hypothetical protein